MADYMASLMEGESALTPSCSTCCGGVAASGWCWSAAFPSSCRVLQPDSLPRVPVAGVRGWILLGEVVDDRLHHLVRRRARPQYPFLGRLVGVGVWDKGRHPHWLDPLERRVGGPLPADLALRVADCAGQLDQAGLKVGHPSLGCR